MFHLGYLAEFVEGVVDVAVAALERAAGVFDVGGGAVAHQVEGVVDVVALLVADVGETVGMGVGWGE